MHAVTADGIYKFRVEGDMDYELLILLALLLSIFVTNANIDLFTNTNFILLLLLALGAYGVNDRNRCCCRNRLFSDDLV